LKLILTTLFIVLFFDGCIVKQSGPKTAQKQPSNAYNLSNRYATPNMQQFNIQDRNEPKKSLVYPTQKEAIASSDAQLQGLIEGSTTDTRIIKNDNKIDIKNIPISNENEITTTQNANESILPTISEVEVIDTTNNQRNVSQLDNNIINAEMRGLYGEFAYPVSIRKTHSYRVKAKNKIINNEIQTTNQTTKSQKISPTNNNKIEPSPQIESPANINSKTQKLSVSTDTKPQDEKIKKQKIEGTL